MKLKPCPFCGGVELEFNRFSLDCKKCKGSMLGSVKEEVIEKWNTRANEIRREANTTEVND